MDSTDTHKHAHAGRTGVLDKDTNEYKQTALTPRQTVTGGMEFSSNTMNKHCTGDGGKNPK